MDGASFSDIGVTLQHGPSLLSGFIDGVASDKATVLDAAGILQSKFFADRDKAAHAIQVLRVEIGDTILSRSVF